MQKLDFKSIVRHGLLGSVIALYFSVIGMVEAFGSRDLIGEYLNLGHLLLFGGIVWAGYAVTTGRRDSGWLTNLVSATVAGALAAVLPLLLVVLNRQIELREVFVNVNAHLMSILTFERSDSAGLLLLLAVSAAGGLLGGLYNILRSRIRRAIGSSLAVTLLMAIFADLVIQVLSNVAGRETAKLFYVGDSMKPAVAVVLFIAFAALFYSRQALKEKRSAEGTVSIEDKKVQLRRRIIQFVGLGIVLLIAPWVLGSFLSQVLFEIGRFVLLGLGLNIVVGYAGLLDLGYVAFFAFGAYTMGILTTNGPLNPAPGLFNFWTALPVVVLVGVFFGVVLGFPVLRMRGDYLAIVTLGFGEIIRILALSDWLSPIMGGAQGVLKIPYPVLFGVEFNSPEKMYYLVLFGSLLAAFISIRLRDSRLGRQWMAMREDEDVAEAMGINLVQTKLLAFAIGAGFSALGGAIFAARLGTIFPHSFNLLISVNALSLIIVGGLGSIPGVIVGAIVLVGLPELLREFTEYRLLMYGILLIVMMLNRPEGFLPAEIFKRELRAGDENAPPASAEA